MAKNSIRDYDATSGNNTDVQSVDISEGCAASGINNALREIMTDLKNVSTGAVALETPAADQLNVDNIRIDGNTISSTDTNGDITLDPNGTGDTVMTGSGGQVTIDENGHITSKQSLDAATAGGRIVGASNRGTVGQIDIAQTTSSADGGHMRFMTCASGSTSPTERLRIDSSGNVGIGDTTPDRRLHAKDSSNRVVLVESTDPYAFTVYKGSGTTDDGKVRFGANGNDALIFAGGSQRYKIDSGGNHMFNKTAVGDSTAGMDIRTDGRTTICRSGSQPLNVSRIGSDGTLIAFLAQGTEEGQITVSGTTVSYNGGHLSRWSQLTNGTKDTSIVKGTVMTNLDQMAEWSYDEGVYTIDDVLPDGVSVGDVKPAYTEDNEQLNCMAVSSVEGDANVAGVFVNWDNDDDNFNDMNIAMTGDMVIRIASGTTVARGDLLMSAGDGTAKPQGDDIVRSKTIAKVTSTTVSHTYDDGTFLVPCVLMAC